MENLSNFFELKWLLEAVFEAKLIRPYEKTRD